jgi:pyruvate dehydrogenase E2 component (dihydrolipoamide acetyltransferase)
MPRLSDSMEEGTVVRWLVADGEPVARGDDLVEIETDKATMTYEADAEGLVQHVAREGDTLPIGTVIAYVLRPGEAANAPIDSQTRPVVSAVASDEDSPAVPSSPGAVLVATTSESGASEGRLKASPVARRFARSLGIDLMAVSGSGREGRIVKADVEAAAAARLNNSSDEAVVERASSNGDAGEQATALTGTAPRPEDRQTQRTDSPGDGAAANSTPATAKGSVTTKDPTRLQQLVARRMAESRATAPSFMLDASADMEEAVRLRARLKELAANEGNQAPSINDFVLRACALTLREYPKANGAYRDGRFEVYERINVGLAVAAEDALVVPTLFDADRKSLGQIAQEARQLAERVRSGAITPPELSGGTFTVSNLGMYGVRSFEAIINPPQAAILAVGALEQRAVVHDRRIVARHVLDLRLACDHRIVYGAEAAEFLAGIVSRLQAPLSLAL